MSEGTRSTANDGSPYHDTPKRYRVVVRGEFGGILSAAFADLAITVANGQTALEATTPDQAAFDGLIDRLRGYALEIISINEIENS